MCANDALDKAHSVEDDQHDESNDAAEGVGGGKVLQTLLGIKAVQGGENPEAAVVDMPADHGACTDGQSGEDGVEAQNGHQAAHQACSGHRSGGHRAADGHQDSSHQEGDEHSGEAALGDHAADGGDGFVLAEDAAHSTTHSGDEQSADGDLEGAAHPVVHDDLEPAALLGQLAAGAVSIGFLDDLVLAAEDQAADSDDSYEQSQNGVAEGVEEAVGGGTFFSEQLADGADGNHDGRQQQGSEGSAGAGSVVLFDEVEKAHPDVFNVLLQVLDDGRITDSQGRTVDFKNTILIMTSNIGSPYLLDGIDENGEIKPEAQSQVMDDLRGHFRPEFLNRIDETIMFQPLNKPQIEQIVRLQINGIRKMLEGNGVTLQMTDAAVDFLATAGYDPEFGARPVKRAIQRYLLNDLSKKLLSQEVNREKPIIVEREGDALKFRN